MMMIPNVWLSLHPRFLRTGMGMTRIVLGDFQDFIFEVELELVQMATTVLSRCLGGAFDGVRSFSLLVRLIFSSWHGRGFFHNFYGFVACAFFEIMLTLIQSYAEPQAHRPA